MKISLMILTFVLIGCGSNDHGLNVPAAPVNIPDNNGLIIIGRTSLKVVVGEDGYARLRNSIQNALIPMAYANPATQPVTVVLAPNTDMNMSSADFQIPVMTNEILSFGSLKLRALRTNDLRRCPGNPAEKC